ncbi:toxin-antitoxin system YwqK family antitoxin [Aquimarina longa]|uniref:toxin-antitoxin system YwqK family antitoxin n=1 Tax=Aquimarina longa TaxID=1080221 RepID=UPI0007839569|nr:hypothetical protein [Aquimarina longa]
MAYRLNIDKKLPKHLIFLCVISIVIVSCFNSQNKKKVIRNYKDGTKEVYTVINDSILEGKLIGYYNSGNISYESIYKNGKKIDSSIYYYDSKEKKITAIEHIINENTVFFKSFNSSGKIVKKGKYYNDSIKIGKWKNYDKNGNLDYIREYKIINDKSYTNQLWYLLPSGDTINNGTSMKYKVSSKRIKHGDSIRFFFQSDVPTYINSDFLVTLPKEYTKHNFNSDFSNIPNDTIKNSAIKHIYSLKYTNNYLFDKQKIDSTKHYKTVVFYIVPKTKGRDTIRGLFSEVKSFNKGVPNLIEYFNETKKTNTSDTITTETRTIYFDIPIEVY